MRFLIALSFSISLFAQTAVGPVTRGTYGPATRDEINKALGGKTGGLPAGTVTSGSDITFPGNLSVGNALLTTDGIGTTNVVNAAQMVGATFGAKIQACHDALPAAGGTCDARELTGAQAISTTISLTKPIELLLGVVTVTSAVNPAITFTDYQTIRGMGLKTAIIASGGGPIIAPAAAGAHYYVVIRGLYVNNTSQNTAGGIGIKFDGVSRGKIVDVSAQDVEIGITLEGTNTTYYNNLENNRIGTVVTGVSFTNGANSNAITGGSIQRATTGIVVDNVSNTKIIGTALELNTTAVSVAPVTASGTIDTFIAGLRIEGSTTGILIGKGAVNTIMVGNEMVSNVVNVTDLGAIPALRLNTLPNYSPYWLKYTFTKIADGSAAVNGTGTCANANGCWDVTGKAPVAASAALSQSVVFSASMTSPWLHAARVKSNVACTGAATSLANTLISTGGGVWDSNIFAYDLKAAVASTNIMDFQPPKTSVWIGDYTVGSSQWSLTVLNTTNNVDQIAAGCSFTLWTMVSILPQ